MQNKYEITKLQSPASMVSLWVLIQSYIKQQRDPYFDIRNDEHKKI